MAPELMPCQPGAATEPTPSGRPRLGHLLMVSVVVLLTGATLIVCLRQVWIDLSADQGLRLVTGNVHRLLHGKVWRPLTSDPKMYIGLPLLVLLNAFFPAVKHEGWFSKALLTDFVWMSIHALSVGGFIWMFLDVSHRLIEPLATPLHFGLLLSMPSWAQMITGYLLIEWMGWFNHLLRHKLKVLWIFHEVHHSQVEMNPFTLFRIHPVDYLAAEAINLLPALLFENTLGIVLAYLSISRLHDALNHSNIRTNLGWLRFVFVTPQSHRVHHSVEPAYFDMNFGVTLCLWDRLFGTHCPSDHVYPRTGIPDRSFPLERAHPVVHVPKTLLAQLLYPFSKMLRESLGSAAGAPSPPPPRP